MQTQNLNIGMDFGLLTASDGSSNISPEANRITALPNAQVPALPAYGQPG